MTDVVQKLWGFCHTLRHDGIDYGDYIEQITFLLFLKMADERGLTLSKGCDWPTLRGYTGTDLTDRYVDLLRELGKAPGLLGDIYAGAQSRFNNPLYWSVRITRTHRAVGILQGDTITWIWIGDHKAFDKAFPR